MRALASARMRHGPAKRSFTSTPFCALVLLRNKYTTNIRRVARLPPQVRVVVVDVARERGTAQARRRHAKGRSPTSRCIMSETADSPPRRVLLK